MVHWSEAMKKLQRLKAFALTTLLVVLGCIALVLAILWLVGIRIHVS